MFFVLPGSPNGACKDAWDEISKISIRYSGYEPCNFIEIMPRLNEK